VALKAQSALLAANMLPRQHPHNLRYRPSPGPARTNGACPLRCLRDGAAGLVVDDHRRVEPANLRLRTVELFHSRLPFTVVDEFGASRVSYR
jgi:hypothetical protein